MITKEKIVRIEETNFKKEKEKDDNQIYEGFKIITNKQTIKLGISNEQDCCEIWGYFMSNDSIDEFIGSELLSIEITDTNLDTQTFNKNRVDACLKFVNDAMFININTNKGILQFVAYNMHNGYYGHDVIIISNQLQDKWII